jgi:putative DNA primase/helicase
MASQQIIKLALSMGWALLPLNGKVPPAGYKFGSVPPLAEDEAIAWRGNLGVLTGPASNLAVIDLDPGCGKTPADYPPTLTVKTGRGGWHLYYRCGEPVPNSAGKLGPHIDTRGCGGYVVAPGSVHPDTNMPYAWEVRRGPGEVALADLPADILAALMPPPAPAPPPPAAEPPPPLTPRTPPPSYASKALEGECSTVASAAEGRRNHTLNVAAFNLGQLVAAGHLDRGVAESRLAEAAATCGLGAAEAHKTIQSGLDSGAKSPRAVKEPEPKVGASPIASTPPLPGSNHVLVLDPKDPLPSAREFVAARFTRDRLRVLHYHRGEFLRWTGTHYAVMDEIEIRAELYPWLERAVVIAKGSGGALVQLPYKPTKSKVDNVVDALEAMSAVAVDVDPPAWLDPCGNDPVAADLVATRNGLLHLPTGRSYTHTPRLLNRHAVEFDYDASATMPEEWLRFLGQLWPNDDEAVRTLQQWFGYCLTCDTRQQKIMLLVGPKRSGKGTIARILTALIGRTNVAAPTLAGLAQNFGMAPLIGATLAIIADARLSGRADQTIIAERLLSISGEDGITIDRKHRSAWTGKLPTRFMVLTNELPRLADASGALSSRFLVLTMEQSFYGVEDHGLEARLKAELPGIFNWAVEGWRDLQRAGRFSMPASSTEAVAELANLGSPVGAFVRDWCVVGAGRTIEVGQMYAAWKSWCDTEGRDHAGTRQSFSRDLKAAVPGLKTTNPRFVGSDRLRFFEGIDTR